MSQLKAQFYGDYSATVGRLLVKQEDLGGCVAALPSVGVQLPVIALLFVSPSFNGEDN